MLDLILPKRRKQQTVDLLIFKVSSGISSHDAPFLINYGTSPFLIGNSTIHGPGFTSYVSLPEGIDI